MGSEKMWGSVDEEDQMIDERMGQMEEHASRLSLPVMVKQPATFSAQGPFCFDPNIWLWYVESVYHSHVI